MGLMMIYAAAVIETCPAQISACLPRPKRVVKVPYWYNICEIVDDYDPSYGDENGDRHYVPHGSLSVPSGTIFHVMAEVVGPDRTFTNVPNACRR
jgi:hypothetical protein